MSTLPKPLRTFSFEQAAFALLLVIGLYFPTSMNGGHSLSAVIIAFALLFSLLTYLAWKHGVRSKVAAFVSLPIMIVLAGSTLRALINGPIQFDPGLFIKFGALALVLALDLRRINCRAFVNRAFVVVNFVNILCGAAILIGSEWISEFLPKYYWTSHDELVPSMLSLHKPVLTFGSHSLAALFLYLFFWVNWEGYKARRGPIALTFALSYFILLFGLTSFTSLGFGALALAQMGFWCWKGSPKLFSVLALCLISIVPFAVRDVAVLIDSLRELPEFTDTVFLNVDNSGLLSRYGPRGTLRGEMSYLISHPFSPVGLLRSESAFDVESPEHFFVGDSGPLEYLVRGSVPLLFLIYFGLYRFLRGNLALRSHGITLFLVIIVFEVGFSALGSSRTYFLLPFFVIYLNQIASVETSQPPHEVVLAHAPQPLPV